MSLKEITSVDNPQVKLLKKLQLKKYRDSENLFAVENLKTILDAVSANKIFSELFITSDLWQKNKDVLEKFKETAEIYLIPEKVNKIFSTLDNPSGITALYKKTVNKESNFDFSLPVVYLNGVSDPGNVGTILRSAVAFGFQQIVADEKTADFYGPKTISSAKDAIFKLNLLQVADLSWLENYKKDHGQIYASSLEGGKNLKEIKFTKNYCLVFGSEGQGVSSEIKKIATDLFYIPTTGKIESLNVATATSIVFYDLFTKK